jgi:hypothetical protein
MSKTRIEQMLQECLDGYEAGLTPEECLSAYPRSRVELEPLLRQALSLRVAYATSPREEFRHQAREQLMFAAGRDVELALASEPDANFILQERTRFLNVAGAAAQEALRDVAPPRLAFWINARRRLLEAAAGTAPAPARRFGAALRYSLSAAVVVIAIAVAALAPLGGSDSPDSPDAALAAIEADLNSIERRTQQGEAISGAELDDLADRTTLIANSIDQFDAARAEKIGGLSVRLLEVSWQIQPDPKVTEAQQQLAEVQQRFGTTASTSPTIAAAIVETTDEPALAVSEEPGLAPTPEPLRPGEVRVTETDDEEYGLTWQQVSTTDVSFVIPDGWDLITVEEDEDGVLRQVGTLAFDTGGDKPVIVLVTEYGQAIGQVSGVALQLRGPGVDGDTIAPETLADLGEIGLALHHFVLSISTTGAP